MGRIRSAWDALTTRAAPLDTLRDRRPVTVASIGGQQTLTLDLDAEARGYAHSAVAYRCVAAIADNASSVPLAVLRPDGETIAGHPVAHLFNKRPNPQMSARTFKSIIVQQLELGGQAFVWLDRGADGTADASEAHPVFDDVQVVVDKPLADRPTTADVVGFIINRADGTRVPVLPGEMLWLRYPHPFDPLGCLAPWKAARHAVDMDAFAREWQRASYENGATPSGVVYLGEMSEDQFAAAKASWRSSMQGPANAGKNLLVASPPGGGQPVSYARVGLTAAEMDYLESRMNNSAEVMMAFGVPHDYLAAGTTYENRSAAKATLWSDTIKPKLEIIGSEIDRLLLPSDAEEAEFDLSAVDALRESQDAVAARVRTNVYTDVVMIDEARAALGYDALPGGIGARTLTPYRAQFAPVTGASADGDDPSARATEGALLGHIPAGGLDLRALVEGAVHAALSDLLAPAALPTASTPTARPAVRTSGPSAAEVRDEYERLEAEGRGLLRKLAKEQSTAVLRDFDRLMKKPQRSAQWLAEVRDGAAQLARDQALTLAPPDLDQVPTTAATRLDVPHWATAIAHEAGAEERVKVKVLFDAKHWARRTRDMLGGWLRRITRAGAESLHTGDGALDPAVLDELAARVDVLADQVTATTRQILEATLLRHGVEQGESVPELRQRIQRVFADLADWRADMVARTETIGSYNAAAIKAAEAAGATGKRWKATADARTRETHRACDGQRVGLGKVFRTTQSRWPADPEAPAAQSINCRCTLLFDFEED